MSEPLPDPLPDPVSPPPLTVASSLVAVQGLVLVGLAVAELADLDAGRQSMGLSTAGFFAAYGALLLVAAWALWGRRPWSRGPALLTQLIFLGLAWNVRDYVLAAVLLAVVALVVLAGILHPDSIRALTGTDEPDEPDGPR